MFTYARPGAGKNAAPALLPPHRSNEIGDFVKRICLLGAVVTAILALGVSSALAAKKSSTGGTKFACTAALTLQAPSNDTNITPDAQSGILAGAFGCPKPLGQGIDVLRYSMANSGDLVGKWQQWFNTGTLYGTFDLTPNPNSQPSDTTTFSAASYNGKFVIKSGTGTAAKTTGTGTIKCATQDSVHYTCKESGRMKLGG
jgi:hypothetical protein